MEASTVQCKSKRVQAKRSSTRMSPTTPGTNLTILKMKRATFPLTKREKHKKLKSSEPQATVRLTEKQKV